MIRRESRNVTPFHSRPYTIERNSAILFLVKDMAIKLGYGNTLPSKNARRIEPTISGL